MVQNSFACRYGLVITPWGLIRQSYGIRSQLVSSLYALHKHLISSNLANSLAQHINGKCQDYVYVKWEYSSTLYLVLHFGRVYTYGSKIFKSEKGRNPMVSNWIKINQWCPQVPQYNRGIWIMYLQSIYFTAMMSHFCSITNTMGRYCILIAAKT